MPKTRTLHKDNPKEKIGDWHEMERQKFKVYEMPLFSEMALSIQRMIYGVVNMVPNFTCFSISLIQYRELPVRWS